VSTPRIVVVGAGHAGFHTALFLRSVRWAGEVVLVDGQTGLPYQRPPLSKEFLAGKQELDDGHFRPQSFYRSQDIQLVGGVRVDAIDADARELQLDGGPTIEYDELVLATGSRPRVLPIPGSQLGGVLTLATATDAATLRSRLAGAEHLVVLGGGFIGLETAAIAVTAGKQVTVFEAADRLMARAVTEPMSRYFERVHRSQGVEIVLSSAVTAIEGDRTGVRAVVTADGRQHRADLVVMGVGSVPNDTLAAEAGIAVDHGIVVDPELRTSVAHISAIGDCARFRTRYAIDQPTVRLESVQNATDQGRFLAGRIAGAGGKAFDAVPWFWTEQLGRKLQIAGLTSGADRIEQVETGADHFSVFCYRGDALIGCESVNAPRDHMRARKELAQAHSAMAGS